MEKEQIKKNATKHIEKIFRNEDLFVGDIVVDITDGEVYVTETGWGSTTASQNNGQCIWSYGNMAHDGLDKDEFEEIVQEFLDSLGPEY